MEKKRKAGGLGRGLSALMADVNAPEAQKTEDGGQRRSDMSVPIENVFPNSNQPRRSFGPENRRWWPAPFGYERANRKRISKP